MVDDKKTGLEGIPSISEGFMKETWEKEDETQESEQDEPIDEEAVSYEQLDLEFNPPGYSHTEAAPQAFGHNIVSQQNQNNDEIEHDRQEKSENITFANNVDDKSIETDVDLKSDWCASKDISLAPEEGESE